MSTDNMLSERNFSHLNQLQYNEASECLILNTVDNVESQEEYATTVKKKPWERGPKSEVKRKKNVNLKDQRVKKYVQPKNAVMCLNEIRSGLQYNTEQENKFEPFFVVSVKMDDEKYLGSGKTKQLAKQAAAEAALASLVKPTTFLGSFYGEDLPWASIASFALYKLLKEWEDKRTGIGTPSTTTFIAVNEVHTGLPNNTSNCSPIVMHTVPQVLEISPDFLEILNAHLVHESEGLKPQPAKQLPNNANILHPVMLLHQMKPDIQYKIQNLTPEIKNVFRVTSILNAKEFVGEGSTIKKAKLNLAKTALQSIFNVDSLYGNFEPKS